MLCAAIPQTLRTYEYAGADGQGMRVRAEFGEGFLLKGMLVLFSEVLSSSGDIINEPVTWPKSSFPV